MALEVWGHLTSVGQKITTFLFCFCFLFFMFAVVFIYFHLNQFLRKPNIFMFERFYINIKKFKRLLYVSGKHEMKIGTNIYLQF